MNSERMSHSEGARLLMQHRTSLYGYIFACVRNHADAEDILQNVSMAVTESITQLQNEAGFLPWAREIARRRVLAFRRASRRELPIDPDLVQRLAEASDRLEEQRPASAQHVALLACLESLPPQSRRLIVLRYSGMVSGVGELSRRYGRTVQAVYAQIKRIKQALRNCVERRLAMEGAS